MPDFTADTPTLGRTFAGHDFSVPAPYVAGYTLTAAEAAWVNAQVAGAVGNAYSGDIRRAEAAKKGSTKDWNHAEKFAARYAEYTLGGSTRGSGSTKSGVDPIEKIAREIATSRINAKIAKHGLTVAAFKASKREDGRSEYVFRIDNELENFADVIFAQAERQHEENLAAAEAADTSDDFAPVPETLAAE